MKNKNIFTWKKQISIDGTEPPSHVNKKKFNVRAVP
jgi:hypothetical protein